MVRCTLPLALLAACGLMLPAVGDEPPNPNAINIREIVDVMGGAVGPAAMGDEDGLPEFGEVTKDMKSDQGLFTLWYYPPAAQDRDQQRLLAQIPADFLGEQFMLSTSIAGGGFLTGFPLDERVVRWELLDKQLLLVEPETHYVVNNSKEVSDVVRRTYPERIRVAVPLVTKAPNGDPVIDFGGLLKSSFADIDWMAPDAFGASINPQLSKWTKRKTFELNVEIGVELAVARRSPPGSYDKTMVHYSFWKLPDSDYQPRVADDRVGYFLTANQDWSRPSDARDIFNRYINRWHLVKRDPSLAVCEPAHPIVFYIEKTVPVRYRRAVRDGILEWNKAFEKIGFVNAIEVRQQTDDNEWKSLDPEDMRYSFFRWIVTGDGFAMGPSRANPFTGQIYDADILFDDSMVRYFEQDIARMLPAGLIARKQSDPMLRELLARYPQCARPAISDEKPVVDEGDDARLLQAMRDRLRRRGCPCCEYVEGMKHQMRLAQTMLAGLPKEVRERFVYESIKEAVTHEVGHTLGLRHNFMASSIYSLDEIKRRRTTAEPTVGSVMDYNAVLFFADQSTEGHFITPTIGPYDYWAIEYGYRPFDESYEPPASMDAEEQEEADPTDDASEATEVQVEIEGLPDLSEVPPEIRAAIEKELPPEIRKMLESGELAASAASPGTPVTPTKAPSEPTFASAPTGEAGMLAEIASRSTEPELAYATDEDTENSSPDPRTNRFDVGSDPIEWARSRIELVDQRMANILDWAVKDKESWYHLRPAFLTLMTEKMFTLDYAGRYIGGQYFNRAHRGDPNAQPPFVQVEPERQRAALAFIEETLFQDDFFAIPPEVLNHLAPPRWWHDGSTVSSSMDFPLHSFISLAQWWDLSDRLYPNTIRRIQDAELKSDAPDKLTAAEYLRRLQAACWDGATDMERLKAHKWTDNEPFLSSIRRSLQREYLGLVEQLVRQRPGDALSPDLHAMMQYSLRTLANDLTAVIAANKADFASQAHLVACKSRIDRMLSAELREYEPISFGSLLLGGSDDSDAQQRN